MSKNSLEVKILFISLSLKISFRQKIVNHQLQYLYIKSGNNNLNRYKKLEKKIKKIYAFLYKKIGESIDSQIDRKYYYGNEEVNYYDLAKLNYYELDALN